MDGLQTSDSRRQQRAGGRAAGRQGGRAGREGEPRVPPGSPGPPAKRRPIETSVERIASRHQDRRAREGAGNFSEM